MKKIILSHKIHEDGIAALQKNYNVVIKNSADTGSYLDELVDASGIVMRIGKITREIIEKCKNLKVLARPGVGVDIFDVQAATEHGIPIVICPGSNTRSVAEHTMALVYAITKNIIESYQEILKSNYAIRDKYTAINIVGLRAGIVGFGAIGRETSKLMRNNGLEISVYDPYVQPKAVQELGYSYEKNLSDLLQSVDIVSLHLPSIPETRGMFGPKEFAGMKKGMFIINCARGDIIDEDALYDAMTTGIVAGAAADLMVDEPMKATHKLFTLPHFIATPHMAALTKQGAKAMGDMVADGVSAVLNGTRWQHVANPDAYNHPRWQQK